MGLKPEVTKSENCISIIALYPQIESPIVAETMADSQMGVFLTLSLPKASRKPSVILNTPPYSAMSCPRITVLS